MQILCFETTTDRNPYFSISAHLLNRNTQQCKWTTIDLPMSYARFTTHNSIYFFGRKNHGIKIHEAKQKSCYNNDTADGHRVDSWSRTYWRRHSRKASRTLAKSEFGMLRIGWIRKRYFCVKFDRKRHRRLYDSLTALRYQRSKTSLTNSRTRVSSYRAIPINYDILIIEVGVNCRRNDSSM